MKLILESGSLKNYIVTIAIGEKYLNAWQNNSQKNWIEYCKKFEIGLIVIEKDMIDFNDFYWKKATWQKMLIGDYLKNQSFIINNICYLDTDFLINHHSPNIFENYDIRKIGLVSQVYNMPYKEIDVKRRIAFLRNKFYDTNYPLDSALFMSLDQIFNYHNLEPQSNYACAGLILFNQEIHSNLMKSWFFKYDRNIESITGGGDECHFNFEVQKWGNILWLDYKYQALWTYEMSFKFPFLYDTNIKTDDLALKCIESSLLTNYFLHFAGSWHESDMWNYGDKIIKNEVETLFNEFYNYEKTILTGLPKGIIKPK